MAAERRLRARWLIASVLVALTAVVPIAYVILPHVHRNLMISRLTSPDLTHREEALSFLVHRAAGDPRVFDGAVAKLAVPDEDNFIQIVIALDQANTWQRGPIPDDAWLRWLGVLAEDVDLESRILAAQMLADLPELATDPRVIEALQELIDDGEREVRLNALAAAAELAGAVEFRHDLEARRPFERMVSALTRDPEPQVARHAWVLLGVLNPISGISAEWDQYAPEVAEAILWAALQTNPHRPLPAIDALRTQDADPVVRAAGAYVLHLSDTDEARAALTEALTGMLEQPAPDDEPLIWRALLALPATTPDAQSAPWVDKVTAAFPATDGDDPAMPLKLAAYHRAAAWLAARPDAEIWSGPALADPLARLAVLEGLDQTRIDTELTDETPPLVRTAALAAAAAPDPAELRPLFSSDVSTLRDLACVVAADRFTDEQNEKLAGDLLKRFDGVSKMSGAILAGLTGVQPKGTLRDPVDPEAPGTPIDLLAYRAENESDWAVKQVMNLGLWMQGRQPPDGSDMAAMAPGLLTRDDLPRTTILLAMLHNRHAGALDFLFNPRGQATVDLVELFDQLRWWRVLERYLPENAPPFWVWADPRLEAFQADVLRDWYLVNRYRLHHTRAWRTADQTNDVPPPELQVIPAPLEADP